MTKIIACNDRMKAAIICRIREHCKLFTTIFQTNKLLYDGIFCNCLWKRCQILSDKRFCTTPLISPNEKQERNLLHMDTMVKYKKSYEYFDMKTRLRNYMYISHQDVVDLAIRSYLRSEMPEDELVFEINPGLGVLTRALLEVGVPHLRVFEDKSVFLQYLQTLKESYPDRMEIIEEDFLHMPFDVTQRKEKFGRLLQGITPRKWKNAPIKVFITLPTKSERLFMKHLIRSIPNVENIFQTGRVEFFIFLSGKEYSYIIAKPKENYSRYLTDTVLYSLLFDVETFGKVERSYFYTPQQIRKSKSKQVYDNTNMYLVKITPKADVFDNGMTSEKLFELIHFVKLCLTKRKRNVLSTLEAYIPNCGPHFIKHGITLVRNFGDLSPQEFLELFNIFTTLPEYEIFKIKYNTVSTNNLHEIDNSDSSTFVKNKDTLHDDVL